MSWIYDIIIIYIYTVTSNTVTSNISLYMINRMFIVRSVRWQGTCSSNLINLRDRNQWTMQLAFLSARSLFGMACCPLVS